MRVAVVGYPMLAKRQWRLCSRFVAAGVDTHVVVPHDWPPIPAADHPPESTPFTVHWSESLFHGWMARYVLPGLPRLLSRIDPDVVLTHGEPWFLGTLYAQIADEIASAPHVVFSWENLERVPRSRLQRTLERLTLARVDGLIAGSDAAAARLRSRGFDGPIVESPQSGIDTEQFAPVSAEDSDESADLTEQLPPAFDVGSGEQIVLYAGRLDSEKGVKTLLNTVSTVRESAPSARYILLGEGSLEAELRTTVDAKGLDEAVDLVTDRQPYDLMPFVYRTADVFVYPSETTDDWAEQFGYSVTEAMSCGVVPVVSDCGSLPWVVGDAGVVVPEGDAGALADKIADLLTDNGQRRRLGAAARERVIAEFGLDSVAATQLSFLASVAGKPEMSLPESA